MADEGRVIKTIYGLLEHMTRRFDACSKPERHLLSSVQHPGSEQVEVEVEVKKEDEEAFRHAGYKFEMIEWMVISCQSARYNDASCHDAR